MYVYFSSNEKQALALMNQWGSKQKAIDNIDEVKLILSDGTIYTKRGYVKSMIGVVDRNTGAVTLRAEFDNTDRVLLSGSTGNIQIEINNNNVLTIPQSATVKIQDKFLVYKVVDGKAQSSQIPIAANNNGTDYNVLTGIIEGDVIVADCFGLVRDVMVMT